MITGDMSMKVLSIFITHITVNISMQQVIHLQEMEIEDLFFTWREKNHTVTQEGVETQSNIPMGPLVCLTPPIRRVSLCSGR
jgi:hypothetical protein